MKIFLLKDVELKQSLFGKRIINDIKDLGHWTKKNNY